MKVSVSWIRTMNRNYGCSDSSELADIDKLVEKIGAQLGAVEEVVSLGEKYKGILIVKVVECVKHPNADKLSLCLVDDGDVNKKVKRNDDGLIQVVCGAPNVKAGMLAAWIPPGTAVPSTVDKEPFVIEAREIRGKISYGMLASPKELDLGDSHEGILALDNGKPGDSLIDNLQLDDYIIDIENKMFTHRPDCFGLLGIAREIAGINHKPFKSPAWYREDADLPTDGRKNVLKLAVKNDLPELVPRFCALAIKDVNVTDSPAWLQAWLARVGIRPINNIVDATNFFMHATGQPLHAYDYDKLKTGTLGARLSKKGEELRLIGGKTIKLDHEAVVITDGNRPVGLGGIMGGADTEVDKKTKNIILECANFDMNTTRRAAMAYGLFTDAATRFTKNQSSLQNRAVLVKAVTDILALAGGRVASQIIDLRSEVESKKSKIEITAEFINSRLGLDLSAAEIKTLLENIEFNVKTSGDKLTVTAPFWRTDIEIPEDVVEEVGRLYGYDKLPVVLPRRDLAPARRDEILAFKARLRDILRRAGANEVLTYSFVHGSLLQKAGQDSKNAYRITNALSPDLQYYRLSLTPSLLDKVHPNIRAGFDEFALFEIGKGHYKGLVDDAGLPVELERLVMVMASKQPKVGAPYFAAKEICSYLLGELGIHNAVYKPLDSRQSSKTATYYEPGRAAKIVVDGQKIGRVGEYEQSVKTALKLPKYCAGFALDIEALLVAAAPPDYQPLNRFPELEQDFCLRATIDLSYRELTEFMANNLAELAKNHGYQFRLEPLDIFQKDGDKAHKQTTWRIILSHPERTLTTEETNKLLDELAARAHVKLKADRV